MEAHTKVGVDCNIQIAVDAKNKMIVEQEVSNQVVYMGLLQQTVGIAPREASERIAERDERGFRRRYEKPPSLAAETHLSPTAKRFHTVCLIYARGNFLSLFIIAPVA